MVARAKKPKTIAPEKNFGPCLIRKLPTEELAIQGAKIAVDINPLNYVLRELVSQLPDSPKFTKGSLAQLTGKAWMTGGVELTVGFMDRTVPELQNKILSYMNRWGNYGNIVFRLAKTDPQVRISRGPGGFWSYLGTDILSIPAGEPTMNLEGFVLKTPDAEYLRVVQHETGHTLGFPHEHLRPGLVARLHRERTIRYFMETQGWSRAEVLEQVLTPLDEAKLRASPIADQQSIMAYWAPPSITIDGQPILGGSDIDPMDREMVGKWYPKVISPPPPPPPDKVRAALRVTVENLETGERWGGELKAG